MSFTRIDYHDVYAFAEKVFQSSQRNAPDLAEEAEKIMDACEDVVGQIRPHDKRLNSGRFSQVSMVRP